MKKILYFLPVIVLLAAGCSANNTQQPAIQQNTSGGITATSNQASPPTNNQTNSIANLHCQDLLSDLEVQSLTGESGMQFTLDFNQKKI